MMKKAVSTRSISKRNSAGIGYITLPLDVDRKTYIANCFKRGAISIVLEDGGVIDDVAILQEAFSKLTFPKTSSEFGSIVFWVNIPKKNQPIVIGTLNKSNEYIGLTENEFSFRKESEFGFVEVSGNGRNGDVNVMVNHNQGRGKINIIASNKSSTAEVNVKVKGNVNVYSTNQLNLTAESELNMKIGSSEVDTLIKYRKGEGFQYLDEFGNEITCQKGETSIKTQSGRGITIDEVGGIVIDAGSEGNIEVKAGVSVVELSEQGVSIDVGDKGLWLNGSQRVLFARSEAATEIQGFGDIGISESTKVGL